MFYDYFDVLISKIIFLKKHFDVFLRKKIFLKIITIIISTCLSL
jgi:hypothetical protein